MVEDRWLSVDEIALYLGVKRDTMYKWIGRKQMPAQLGRSKRLIRITPMLMGVPPCHAASASRCRTSHFTSSHAATTAKLGSADEDYRLISGLG